MICQLCKRSFPHRKGRFCGTCKKPTPISTELRDLMKVADKIALYASHALHCQWGLRRQEPCKCGMSEAWDNYQLEKDRITANAVGEGRGTPRTSPPPCSQEDHT